MTDVSFDISASAVPYSDGSGHQVSATVKTTAEGIRLSIEMTYQIPIGDWPTVRRMIDQLVATAEALSTAERGEP